MIFIIIKMGIRYISFSMIIVYKGINGYIRKIKSENNASASRCNRSYRDRNLRYGIYRRFKEIFIENKLYIK